MTISMPKTRGQWIVTIIGIVVVLLFLLLFTKVFQGQAVEVSVENASQKPVFAYIDNTGRHGDSTPTTTLATSAGGKTPAGLLIQPGTTRSFGTAVGLFDSPTLHVLAVGDSAVADASSVQDCVFDTVSLRTLEIPSLHAKVKWTGSGCTSKSSPTE